MDNSYAEYEQDGARPTRVDQDQGKENIVTTTEARREARVGRLQVKVLAVVAVERHLRPSRSTAVELKNIHTM
jgi:hypothetical protein